MSQTRRKFLRNVGLGASLLSGRATPPARSAETATGIAPRRPNLLLLWTDQHRADTMPYTGNRVIVAPHLKTLGEKSFVFLRAYCTMPVCTPSRGSILTGLLPHHHGAADNNIPLHRHVRTLPEHLSSEYVTGYFGKWHLGDEILVQHGFQQWRSIEDNYQRYYSNTADRQRVSTYHDFLVAKGFPPDVNPTNELPALFSRNMAAALPEPYTKAAYLGFEAGKFLRDRRDGQPFVLSVNMLEPHPPTYGPLNEKYMPGDVPVGPAFAKPVGPDAGYHHRRRAETFRRLGYKNHPIETVADWRRLRANYYGLVTMVDNAFGRILRALEESGQADRTIIVYTSDHGEMGGDHCLMQKGVFYEQAARIPLMIHVPWLSRRQVRFHGPFSQIDLVPTLLELMGCEPKNPFDGISRAGVLRNPSRWRDEDVVVIWNENEDPREDGRCLVGADGWKLTLFRGDGPELYDLNSDPGELRNLGRDRAQADRIRRMGEGILAWQQKHGDKLPLVAS